MTVVGRASLNPKRLNMDKGFNTGAQITQSSLKDSVPGGARDSETALVF